VSAKSYEDHRTGQRLSIAGYVAGAVGLGLEIGALAVNSSSEAEPVLLWSGVGTAVAAVALAISSYILLQPTDLSQSSATHASREATAPWRRLPAWQARATPTGPTITSLSLFSARF
jgi:hypothetical protein